MPLQLNGGSYGLRQVDSSDKTVLLMKLTDSALRMIESYQDHSTGMRKQPSIKFQGNQGVIQIPTLGGDPELQAFTFQVSNLPPSAGVDCLQQIRSGQTGRIECLGSVQQKVTINATDDSYNMTRKRMTLAKEEEQKTSTKVIKQPGSKIGKLFKKKTGKGRIVEKQHNHSAGRLSPDTRAPTPPLSRLTPTLLNNRSSSPLTIPNKDSSSSPPGVAGTGRNKTKPMMLISSTANSASSTAGSGAAPNAAVASRPLWDRVAHLLAVRPYKYPEIVLRLTRDGPPDKNRLQTILQQHIEIRHLVVNCASRTEDSIKVKVAATRNTQGGGTEYVLLRSCYNKIDNEWSGYTEAERKSVKKKMSESGGLPENRKRTFTAATSPSKTMQGKDDDYSNPTVKKQRVSHFKKPSPGRPNNAPASGCSPPTEVDSGTAQSPATSSGISFGTTKLPPKDTGPVNRPRQTKNESLLDLPDYDILEKPMQNSNPGRNDFNPHKFSPKKSSKRNSSRKYEHTKEEEDYMKKYVQISSVEQRDRYKSDFYAEYQEYLGHHSNVAAVSNRFADLQRKLNEHKKGSQEYEAISRQVVQEYKKTKKNDSYHQDRARMQFLHRKLQHIKLLVNDFDRHKLASNRTDNDPGLCMQTKTATRVA